MPTARGVDPPRGPSSRTPLGSSVMMPRRMLPAWATVVIALGGAAIGAAAGVIGSYFTLRGARLQIEHEEREAWRSRLVAAAERFLESYERGATSTANFLRR